MIASVLQIANVHHRSKTVVERMEIASNAVMCLMAAMVGQPQKLYSVNELDAWWNST